MNRAAHNPESGGRENREENLPDVWTCLHLVRAALGVSFIILVTACALFWNRIPLHQQVPAFTGAAVGLVLFLPGAWLALAGVPAGKALLGGGMAFLLLSAIGFAPEGARWTPLMPGMGNMGFCAGLLVLFAFLSYRVRSQSTSLLTCLLGAYLLYRLLPDLSPVSRTATIIVFSLLILGWSWLWLSRKQGRIFPEGAVLILYGVFILFAADAFRPAGLSFSPVILSLLFVYVILNLQIMHVSLQRERVLTGFAVINGLGFGGSLWYLTGGVQAGPAWLAPMVLLVAGFGAARVTRAYALLKQLSDVYVCQAFLALAWLVLMYLPGGGALILVALLCFLPALFGKRYDGRVYSVTEFGFMTFLFVVSLSRPLPSRFLILGPVSLSLAWGCLIAAAAVLVLLARLHDVWGRSAASIRPGNATAFRIEQQLCSAVCLFSAALFILLHTILRRNDSESLPLLLALEGFLFLGLGLVFFLPGLALAGLIPVMAGHACYYAAFFLLPSDADIPTEGRFRQVAVLLLATLLLALLCDWLMGRRVRGRPSLSERMLVLLPYGPLFLAPLAVGFLEEMPPVSLAAGLSVAGLMALGAVRLPYYPLPGLQALGCLAVAISLMVYIYGLFAVDVPAYSHNSYLPYLGLYLVMLMILERAGGRRAFGIRLMLCLGIAALGVLGLYPWNNGPVFAVSLAGLAILMALGGCVFNVRAYYYTAGLLMILAVAWGVLSSLAWIS